jgi:hypothetical protein
MAVHAFAVEEALWLLLTTVSPPSGPPSVIVEKLISENQP